MERKVTDRESFTKDEHGPDWGHETFTSGISGWSPELLLLLLLHDSFGGIERDVGPAVRTAKARGTILHSTHAPSHHEEAESHHDNRKYPPPSEAKPKRDAACHFIPPLICRIASKCTGLISCSHPPVHR